MVNFALQTRKTSPNHDFFIKNQAKPLICHGDNTILGMTNMTSRHTPVTAATVTDTENGVPTRFRGVRDRSQGHVYISAHTVQVNDRQ